MFRYASYLVLLFILLGAQVLCVRKIKRDSSENTLVINTLFGPVEGITLSLPTGNLVDAFFGIPYGKPPVGKLRFAPTQKPVPWTDTLIAKSKPPSCFQSMPKVVIDYPDKWWVPNEVKFSEDCLKLNVWVPKPRKEDRPVIVYFPGVMYQSGSANIDLYNGGILATENDVIVVTVNIRVSAFGFLYFNSSEAPGNLGLMDQAASLRWLHRNIFKFGGDVNRVTVVGDSSGFLLFRDFSTCPFHNAVLMSGAPNAPLSYYKTDRARAASMALAGDLGCTSSNQDGDVSNIIECLQSKEAPEIAEASTNLNELTIPFLPVIDGHFISGDPLLILENQNIDWKNILLGTNSEDGVFLLPIFSPGKSLADENTNFLKTEIQGMIKNSCISMHINNIQMENISYIDWEGLGNVLNLRTAVKDILTDFFYICPSNQFSEQYALKGNKVFRYSFSHKSSKSLLAKWTGSLHGEEIPFLFGLPLDVSRGFSNEDVELSKIFMRYLATFARTGDPNADPSMPTWKRYSPEERAYLKIMSSPTLESSERLSECKFWDKLTSLANK